jgi:mono/diheme cytochrome c family protein
MTGKYFAALMVSLMLTSAVAATPEAPESQRRAPGARAPEQKPAAPPKPSAETVSRGQLLYENHCMHCHESTLHIRQARRADSLQALEGRVIRWSDQQRLNWNPDDVADVVDYLNRRYYKFPSPSRAK